MTTKKPITAEELERWQRGTDAASSLGEWRVFRAMGRNTFIERNSLKYESSCFDVGSENDARFIAMAREAMPRLLAEVVRWRRPFPATRDVRVWRDKDVPNRVHFTLPSLDDGPPLSLQLSAVPPVPVFESELVPIVERWRFECLADAEHRGLPADMFGMGDFPCEVVHPASKLKQEACDDCARMRYFKYLRKCPKCDWKVCGACEVLHNIDNLATVCPGMAGD